MTSFNETMKLKEQSEENIYFAKRDRELIEALHLKNINKFDNEDHGEFIELVSSYRDELEKLEQSHKSEHHQLSERYQELFAKIKKTLPGSN